MKRKFFFLAFIIASLACNKKQNFRIPAKNDPIIKDHNYILAKSFQDKNSDSAFYYFNKITTTSKDSFYVALAYNAIAAMQDQVGDYFGNQESLTMSLRFLNEKKSGDSGIIASDYNGLGLNSANLKKYGSAQSYYDLALKFNTSNSLRLIIRNNKALAYQHSENYDTAIQIFNEIIPKYRNDPGQYARAISNLAKTKWLQNSDFIAAPAFLKALSIRTGKNDLWGQNASYAQLADYYMLKRKDSALFYADKMYQVAKKLKSPDDQIEALQKLIRLSPAQKTKQYFDIYQKMADSLQAVRNSSKNQFALIRYETEKNKADNLRLQKENADKKYQITKQRIIIAGILLLIVGVAVISILWYKKRKQRVDLEAQNSIRENKLKTSKKVHDVVANGLYRVMREIDNQEDINKGNVLDKIEVLYEKSRNISYEEDREPQLVNPNFQEKITDLLKPFQTKTTQVNISGNTRNLWKKVTIEIGYELEHVLQELMVNMSKHSHADLVTVRFRQESNKINIIYIDNGVGIPEGTEFKNGLTSTGNRIKSISGTINFDIKAKKGLKIQISFPVS